MERISKEELRECLNEMNEKRVPELNPQAQKLFYTIMDIMNENDELNSKKCLHCGENEPNYCENCYQELITENAKLQAKNQELKEMLQHRIQYTNKLEEELYGAKGE